MVSDPESKRGVAGLELPGPWQTGLEQESRETGSAAQPCPPPVASPPLPARPLKHHLFVAVTPGPAPPLWRGRTGAQGGGRQAQQTLALNCSPPRRPSR